MSDGPDRFSSPELTGGAGFAFEDEVVGFFIVCLLSGTGMTGTAGELDGRIVRIACQQANAGWHPDDVLVTLQDPVGERRCALSLKSYSVLSANGLTGAGAEGDASGAGLLFSAALGPFDGQSTHPSVNSPEVGAQRALPGIATL